MPASAAAIETNPIADLRRTLIANGYWPIPVQGKRPTLDGWSTLNMQLDEVEGFIHDHPRLTNTGILTGELVAVDIDAPTPAMAEKLIDRLFDIVPAAAGAPSRIGKAPKVLFIFRATESRKNKVTGAYNVDGEKHQVEVLGQRHQFVAFGIHPDTGRPYEWSNGDPTSVPFDELPTITPDQIDDYLADSEAILSASGTPLKEKKSTPATPAPVTGNTVWDRVNAAAFANLDAWVPHLGLVRLKRYNDGYIAVASFRSSKNAKLSDATRQQALELSPDGICDHGDNDKGYSPISMVRTCRGGSNSEALLWLCDALRVDPADLGWEPAPPSVKMSFSSSKPAPVADNDDDMVDDEDDEGEYETVSSEQIAGLPEHMCFPPGAVGEFAQFIVDCARFPSPHLALVSALSLTAGLIGRRYKGPTKLRSNIYAIGLAESGFGKDNTIRTSAAIADSTDIGAKISQSIFMDKIRSMPGIATKLRKSPSVVAVVDEFGSFLKTIAGDNISEGKDEIRSALMELTGAPMGYWGGMEKASGNIPRIVQPCFSIHGISTPSTFWDSLSSGNISEGLLGRLVLIDVGNAEPVKVMDPKGDPENVPGHLSQYVKDLLGATNGRYSPGPFYALAASSEMAPYPMITADWESRGVHMMFEEFDNEIRSRKKKVEPKYRPILNRVAENAGRLALIVAVGCDHKNPVITRGIQEWANAVAENALSVIIAGASENIADNALQREYMRVLNIVTRTKKKGITHGSILRTVKGSIQNRRIDDILVNLRKAKEVHFSTWMAPSGQTQVRYWSAKQVPKDAAIHSPWVD